MYFCKMRIKITLHCPDCQSEKIKKNGKKTYKKQNYLCKNCGRQFIGDHALSYKGCHSDLIQRILRMLVRCIGIRNIAVIEDVTYGSESKVKILAYAGMTEMFFRSVFSYPFNFSFASITFFFMNALKSINFSYKASSPVAII